MAYKDRALSKDNKKYSICTLMFNTVNHLCFVILEIDHKQI